MDSFPPEVPLSDRKRLIDELIQVRELVKKLKVILDKPFGEDKYLVANDLLVEISSSFTGSISMMNQSKEDTFPESSPVGMPKFDTRKEVSHDSSKSSVFKDRRGCYKRRTKSHTSIQIVPNLIDDGHAWRKYGQKRIQNAQQPRNYFRCTHKFDQGCQATKQVQKTEDELPMYQITYHGKHTCKNPLLKPHQLMFDDRDSNDSKFYISFDSRNKLHEDPTFTNFEFMKQEYDPTLDYNKSQSSDRHMLPDPMTIGSFEPISVFSSGSDCEDLISYFSEKSAPSCEFDQMKVMEGFHEFWDDLEFDF